MEKLDGLNTKDLFRTEEEMIRLAEWEKQVMLDDAREEGLKQGYEEGIEKGIEQGIEKEKQNTIKIIKEMVKNNIELETISKITGKTIEEIKEISK